MRNRRKLLTLLGVGVSGLAGCGGSGGSGNSTTTAGQLTDTATEQPTEQPTEESTEEPTEEEEPVEEGSDVIRPDSSLAEEGYNEVVDEYSSFVENLDYSEGDSFEETVRNLSVAAASSGTIAYNSDQTLDTDTSAEHVTAALQTLLDDFNYTDGDIAAPHLVYNVGQVPATAINYQNEAGETIDDLLTTNGRATDSDNMQEDWTTARASNDYMYWDDGPAATHILDADSMEDTFGDLEPNEVDVVDGIKEDFSALAYNNSPHNDAMMDVGITVGSWDAWYAAEEKVNNGEAKDFFDDITALANDSSIDNFAFGYDEEMDEFVATETYTDSEYEDLNPFEYLNTDETVTSTPAA